MDTKEKKKIANRLWAKNNPDKVKIKAKKYYDSHPLETKARRKRYYDEHRDEAIEYSKSYAKNNPDIKSAYMKKWRLANKEKIAAYMKIYRKENSVKIKGDFKKWCLLNPEKAKAAGIAWREANHDRVKSTHSQWRVKHPDKLKVYNHEKKARKRNATIEKFSVSEIYERDSWICQLCGELVSRELSNPHPFCASLDHIIPLSKGGEHSRKNTQLTHLICNMRKSSTLPLMSSSIQTQQNQQAKIQGGQNGQNRERVR